MYVSYNQYNNTVALRKESVDRNVRPLMFFGGLGVALRKESVDKMLTRNTFCIGIIQSLSRKGERG